ncbi:MAG: hypothetical protein E7449_02335 [Ruminococcaceae bacterium]|nr:hypothetical protein [Oscillospiraceae bacterium]
MNEVISAILNRKCIRAFTDEPIAPEVVDTILQCGIRAPSALNSQPWHFTVLKSRRMMDKIIEGSTMGDYFRGGVMAILISGKVDSPWAAGDCANAAENMCLAASALGIGCCYLASPRVAFANNPELQREAGIPEGYEFQYALTLGHPAEDPELKPRNEDCVTYID